MKGDSQAKPIQPIAARTSYFLSRTCTVTAAAPSTSARAIRSMLVSKGRWSSIEGIGGRYELFMVFVSAGPPHEWRHFYRNKFCRLYQYGSAKITQTRTAEDRLKRAAERSRYRTSRRRAVIVMEPLSGKYPRSGI